LKVGQRVASQRNRFNHSIACFKLGLIHRIYRARFWGCD
jgi:hypothetical protein